MRRKPSPASPTGARPRRGRGAGGGGWGAGGWGEPQAVEEVMQEVALAAVAQRSPLHDPARAAVWLYRLAVRHVLLYRRKTGRARALVDRYAARTAPGAVDGSVSPLAWLLCKERQRLVQEALTRLPPR